MKKDKKVTIRSQKEESEEKKALRECFGLRFNNLRIRRGYKTIQSFADAYYERFEDNVLSSVKKWDSGNTLPGFMYLKNICELLDCDPLYLMGELPENCTSKEMATFKEYTGLSETSLELLSRWNVEASPQVAKVIDFILSYRQICVESGEHGSDLINRLNRFLMSDTEEVKYSPRGVISPPDENGLEWISDVFFDTISFDDAALTGISGILRDMKKEWKKQNKGRRE